MTDSDDPDRPSFPDLRESIGEDPAWFLHGREKWVALARIRGIHEEATLGAWKAVERRLASRTGREPRPWVMEALGEREAYIEEHGEFDPEEIPGDFDTPDPEDLGPYPPELWKKTEPGSLPQITPHRKNRAEAATDGGESVE